MTLVIDECFDPMQEGVDEFWKKFECETCRDTGILTSTHICEGFTYECEDCA